MTLADRAPPRFSVTPANGLPSEVVIRPLILAGAAVGALASRATTKGETVLVRAQIVLVLKLPLMVRFTSPGSPCNILKREKVLKSVEAGIVMQVVTGAVKLAVVVMFNSGQAVQCTYGGGSVCAGA